MYARAGIYIIDRAKLYHIINIMSNRSFKRLIVNPYPTLLIN
jgi:hypothetical protein